jgi:hypothetical protein
LCLAWQARSGHLYEQTPQGLQLRASLESLTQLSETRLVQLAENFLASELERVGSLDDTATSVLPEVTQISTVQLDQVSYELMLLSCAEGTLRRVAGVVALTGIVAATDPERLQLIPAIAAQLLEPS